MSALGWIDPPREVAKPETPRRTLRPRGALDQQHEAPLAVLHGDAGLWDATSELVGLVKGHVYLDLLVSLLPSVGEWTDCCLGACRLVIVSRGGGMFLLGCILHGGSAICSGGIR
eukprot:CAMPEP_0171127128 /NCGR_PEP_ID=MMETSP0766_2-20121228/114671_1 /TAXON_ID=439317 /ORGANISM="Gambierdiscus australes, Strain CAWD 149" /LENGTH=114 /DNA_ID=CAMNT_0011590215 /DNA_START=137 /DNA_END=477 /DNA_ORIENTATION=+